MASKSAGTIKVLLTLDPSRFNKGLIAAESKLEKVSRSMRNVGDAMSLGLTAPILAVAGASTKMAGDLEAGFAKIENLVGVTGKPLEEMKKGLRDISDLTGKSQLELVEGLFVVTSAGIRDSATALEILGQSAKASTIGMGATANVARAATAVVQAYGSATISASRAVDVMTLIVREGNLETESLAPTLGRVIGLAQELGISFEETGAFVATFTRLGVNAEEAITALRGTMNAILSPAGEMGSGLEKAGLSIETLRKSLREQGLAKTLISLSHQMKELGLSVTDVFGNVRAAAGVLGVANKQADAYLQITENINNATGVTNDSFKNLVGTLNFDMARAWNLLRNIGMDIGESLFPVLIKTLAYLRVLFGRFSDLSEVQKRNILVVTGLTAASGPLLSIFGRVLPIIVAVSGALMKFFAFTQLAASGSLGLNIAMAKLRGGFDALAARMAIWAVPTVIVAGIMSVAYAFYKIADGIKAIGDAWGKLNFKQIAGLLSLVSGGKAGVVGFSAMVDAAKGANNGKPIVKQPNIEAKKMIEYYANGAMMVRKMTVEEEALYQMTENTRDTTAKMVSEIEKALGLLNGEDDKTKKKQKGVNKFSLFDPNELKGKLFLQKNMGTAIQEALFGKAYDINNSGIVYAKTFFKGVQNAIPEMTMKPTIFKNEAADALYERVADVGRMFAQMGLNVSDEFTTKFVKVESWINKWAEALQYVGELMSNIGQIVGNVYQGKIEATEEAYRREIDAIKKAGYSESERVAKVTALEEERDKKLLAMKRKQASIDKALGIVEAIIGTAVAVASAKHLWQKIAFAAIGAAQVAAIASQPLPKMAKGGLLYGRTLFEGGEYPGARTNPEVIAPLDKLKGILGGSNNVFVTGMISGYDLKLVQARAEKRYSRM